MTLQIKVEKKPSKLEKLRKKVAEARVPSPALSTGNLKGASSKVPTAKIKVPSTSQVATPKSNVPSTSQVATTKSKVPSTSQVAAKRDLDQLRAVRKPKTRKKGKKRKKRALSEEAKAAARSRLAAPIPINIPLQRLLGKKAVSRAEAVRGIWDHIRSHGLKDKEDGRIVKCDKKLRSVLGDHDFVHILNIPKLLNPCFQAEVPTTVKPTTEEIQTIKAHVKKVKKEKEAG